MRSTVLICGHRAFVARGFEKLLRERGHRVLCFSRGEEMREGDIITGDVLKIDSNPYLNDDIDIVVNFVFLKGRSIEDNIEYIKRLKEFALKHHVKYLIQISSISSYSNDVDVISEQTPLDKNGGLKGYYGAVKTMVDQQLEQYAQDGLSVVFVRPGYVTSRDKENPLGGIVISLPFNGGILKGDTKSTLPTVSRDDLQSALLDIIEDDNPNQVYLLVSQETRTKMEYAQSVSNRWIIPLPKDLTLCLAKMLHKLHLVDERKYQMIKGQFKVNHFDAERTYQKIGKRL